MRESDEPFKHRERIRWTYTHAVGRNRFRRTKDGIFVVMKLEKHYNTWGPYQRSTRLAKVQFDGNSGMSVVPVSELRSIEHPHLLTKEKEGK